MKVTAQHGVLAVGGLALLLLVQNAPAEPESDPSVATVNPSKDDPPPLGLLSFDLAAMHLPEIFTIPPEIFTFEERDVTLDDEQEARLDILAASAIAREGTKAVVVAIALPPDRGTLQTAQQRAAMIVDALVEAGVPRKRIVQNARRHRKTDRAPPGTVVVAIVDAT